MVIRVPDQRAVRGGYAALDDRVLVLDFQAGNPEAFVEIHERYGGLAHQVCRRFLPNPHDAEEAFQETMIRVFRGLYRFNGRYALVTMCIGGGQGIAAVFEAMGVSTGLDMSRLLETTAYCEAVLGRPLRSMVARSGLGHLEAVHV